MIFSPVFVILISISVNSVLCSMGFMPKTMNALEGKMGVCFDHTFENNFMKIGTVKQLPGVCITLTCLEDSSILISGCPRVACEGGKFATIQDVSKRYPQCCPTCSPQRSPQVYNGFRQ